MMLHKLHHASTCTVQCVVCLWLEPHTLIRHWPALRWVILYVDQLYVGSSRSDSAIAVASDGEGGSTNALQQQQKKMMLYQVSAANCMTALVSSCTLLFLDCRLQ